MPVPVAIPFSQILGTAGTATVLGKPSETKTEEDVVPFSDVLAKRFSQNLSSILQKTIDTPSGKVFAPDDPIPAKPNILATYPQSKDQPWIMGSPMPAGEPQGIMGLPMPEAQDKLKGFKKPQDVDMKILYKVENDEPKFKYPTKEEIEKYINEENEFWIKNQERANERYPELSSKNLPKITEADKHFGAAAFSFQDFKNSKLIYMSPKEYLNLTQKFRPKEGEENLGSTMNVQNIENLLKEGKELANIPMLYVKKTGDSFVVTGQEGIHRAKAFNNLGYDKIPVVVEGSTRAHAKEIKDIFPTNIQSESGEVLLTKPEDFYSVISKKKLFNPESTIVNVPVGNQIKTWEYLTPDKNKAEEIAKNNNISLKELERLAIKDQITFKPKGMGGYDIYFDGKFIGELDNITKGTGGEVPKNKYGDAYNINLIDRSLNTDNVDTQNGLNYSKEHSKDIIANSLLDLDENNQYSLRSFFPDIKYDKKGNIIQEEITSNPVGSLIDKPLSDETN
jgi:hypothetical protein